MKNYLSSCVTVLFRSLIAIFLTGSLSISFAGDFFVYPANNQSNEQQKRDEFECYSWAKGKVGYDPMDAPTATAPPPVHHAAKGGAVKGALGGAAAGALFGQIADHKAGEGAAIGAIAGSLFGGMRRRNQVQNEREERQSWETQQVTQYEQQRNNYNRAYVACLEGKGYNVK